MGAYASLAVHPLWSEPCVVLHVDLIGFLYALQYTLSFVGLSVLDEVDTIQL